MAKRFATHSEEEIIEKRAKTIPSATVRANNQAANIFREYLQEKQQPVDFENFDVFQLF